MAEQQRRLAAIVAMDVAGYSRLMGQDERDTLNRLTEHRAAIDPIGLEHGGRIVGTAGDGVLVEFPSVVEAVNFALRCQAVMAERNASITDEEKMLFRIGINLGDVLVQDDDFFGDGVNVAARIEGLAEPGGIWVSRTVRDSVRDKLDVQLEDQGEVEVKNIARPVRVFRLSADKDVVAAIKPVGTVSAQTASTKGDNRKLVSSIAALGLILILAGGGYWWWQQQSGKIATALPDKPSIAVLPFDNLSNDPNQEFFADGMAEDIITDLSKISGLFVIARNSSFSYKGQQINIKTVGRELGVHFVLEGSVRRVGNELRINAQLINAATGGHVWADRFDGSAADVFQFQDTVSERVIEAMKVNLNAEERSRIERKPTENTEAYDYYLKARKAFLTYRPDQASTALSLYQKAIDLDPQFAEAHAGDALAAAVAWADGWIAVLPASVALERANSSAARALALDTDNVTARRALFRVAGWQGRGDEAMALAQEASTLQPNNAELLADVAMTYSWYGEKELTVAAIEKVTQLEPIPAPYSNILIGWAWTWLRRYEEAIAAFSAARETDPNLFVVWDSVALAAAHGHRGETEKAKAAVARLLTGFPAANRSFYKVFFEHAGDGLEHFIEGLRLAGLPQWPYGYVGRKSNRLKSAEIRQLVQGKLVRGKGRFQGSHEFYLFEDGNCGHWIPKFQYNGKGTCEIRDDMICASQIEIFDGRPFCFPIYRNPQGTVSNGNQYIMPDAFELRTFAEPSEPASANTAPVN